MDATQAFSLVREAGAGGEFPRLATGAELAEHTRGFFLLPGCRELRRLGELLDEYQAAAEKYRKARTVHERGILQFNDLRRRYREQLKLWGFQRRYCVEMARGLKLERNALARPRNQAFTSAEHARAIWDAERTVYHPHTLSFDLSASCEELRREESVLEILEPAQNDTADTHAIASRKRTELLLRENVTPEEWLTQVAEAGFARPSLQQMQAQLRQTELQTQRMQAQLRKKRQHLVRHSEDIGDAHAATAARLREVCGCFQELRAIALRRLAAHNEGGFLAKLQRSIRQAGRLLVATS
jgi:hypothetical protein